MAEKITESEAITMITTVLNEKSVILKRNTELESVGSWDSLGVLLLMSELDERFSISLNEDQIEHMATVGDIVDYMAQNEAIA